MNEFKGHVVEVAKRRLSVHDSILAIKTFGALDRIQIEYESRRTEKTAQGPSRSLDYTILGPN